MASDSTEPRETSGATTNLLLRYVRELGGEQVPWEGGPDKFVSPYFGYLTREECAKLLPALDEAAKRQRTRPSGITKQLRAAAEECVRAELDLLAYVG